MSRRLKRLEIRSGLFASIFGAGPKAYEVVKDGLPPDAVVVHAQMSLAQNSVVLFVQSDEFDHVPEGEHIPAIDPAMAQSKLERPNTATVEALLFTTRHDFIETYRATVDNYHELARGFCENPDHRYMAGYRAVAVDVKPIFSTTFESLAQVNIEVAYRHVTSLVKPKAAN